MSDVSSAATTMTDSSSAITDHRVTMSPAEATAALEAKAAAFHRVDAPLVPVNAREAQLRLNALSRDGAWVQRYLAGDVKTVAEARSLNEMVANGPVELAGGPVESSQAEVIMAPYALRRADLLGVAADLRALWGDEAEGEGAIAELLDPERTGIDSDLLQQVQISKAQALKDPDFCRDLLDDHPEAVKRMRLWNFIIAIGTP